MKNQIYNAKVSIKLLSLNDMPVVKRQIKTQTVYPAEAYDDYGIGGLYPSFSFNFAFLLIIAGVLIAIIQVLLFIGAIILAVVPKTKKCKVCGGENHLRDGKFPKKCTFCGADLQ